MTVRSRRRFHVVFWTLCCLLLSQWALAAHACAAIERAGNLQSQGQLEVDVAAEVDAAPGRNCHGVEPVTAKVPADSSAICMKHCADERGATGEAITVAAAAMAPPAVIRTLLAQAPVLVHWEHAPASADATAPPLSILYGVFLS